MNQASVSDLLLSLVIVTVKCMPGVYSKNLSLEYLLCVKVFSVTLTEALFKVQGQFIIQFPVSRAGLLIFQIYANKFQCW